MIFNKFFETNSWEYKGSILILIDATLKVPIKDIEKGKFFDNIIIDFEEGTISFIEYDIAEAKVLPFGVNIDET